MPVCPHCRHTLSSSEVGALYGELRKSRSGGRPKVPTGRRKKPRAYEAMPIAMQALRASPKLPLRTGQIHTHVREELTKRGYQDKPMATSWGLNYLQQKGFATNVRHGFWLVTAKGLKEPMTEELGMEITAEIERS